MNTILHPSKQLESWIPERWDEFVACREAKQSLHSFATTAGVGSNLVLVGINRTAKTTLVKFAVKAKRCQRWDEQGNPCQLCPSCKAIWDGRWSHAGLFAIQDGCKFDFYPISGQRPDAREIDEIIMDALNGDPMILVLDEVDAPAFRPYQARLQTVIELSNVTCLATAIALKGRREKRRVSAAFTSRFSEILSTTVPQAEELVAWMNRLCDRFRIERDQEGLHRIAHRTHCIPGQAKRFLVHALRINVKVDLNLANTFDLDSN